MGLELRPRSGRLRCPYCRDTVIGGRVRCECGARFHEPCAAALEVCSTLGCGRDVRPEPRGLLARTESGCGVVALSWGIAVALMLLVIGSVSSSFRIGCRFHEGEPQPVLLRARRPSPSPLPTFEDLRLMIAAIPAPGDDDDVLRVRLRIQSLAREPVTLSFDRGRTHLSWERAGAAEDWLPLGRMPWFDTELVELVGSDGRVPDPFVPIAPGDWVERVRVLRRSWMRDVPERLRVILELDPPQLCSHVAREQPRCLGGILVSNELALH